MEQIAFNDRLFIIGVCYYRFSHSDSDALLWCNIKKRSRVCFLVFVSGQQGFGSLIFIDKVITAPKINKSAARDKVLDLMTLGRFVKLINFLGVASEKYCGAVIGSDGPKLWDHTEIIFSFFLLIKI